MKICLLNELFHYVYFNECISINELFHYVYFSECISIEWFHHVYFYECQLNELFHYSSLQIKARQLKTSFD